MTQIHERIWQALLLTQNIDDKQTYISEAYIVSVGKNCDAIAMSQ